MERHFRELIRLQQWWEATRIFTFLSSRSEKGCPEIPVKTLVKLYEALILRFNSNDPIESSPIPGQSDENTRTLVCALVTKSMFMDRIVTTLQEGRQVPTGIDAWELHTEVGQLLQQIDRDFSCDISGSRYCDLWKSCQTKLTNVQQSRLPKHPSLYAEPKSGTSSSATTPERLIPSDNREGAIIASSSEIASRLAPNLPSATHSNE